MFNSKVTALSASQFSSTQPLTPSPTGHTGARKASHSPPRRTHNEQISPDDKLARVRTCITTEQKTLLEASIAMNQYPSRHEFSRLEESTRLPRKTIRIWFQNQRQKALRTKSTVPPMSQPTSTHTEPASSNDKPRRVRTHITAEQQSLLKAELKMNHMPSKNVYERLEATTKLPRRVIQVWFTNHRCRIHKQMTQRGMQESSTSVSLNNQEISAQSHYGNQFCMQQPKTFPCHNSFNPNYGPPPYMPQLTSPCYGPPTNMPQPTLSNRDYFEIYYGPQLAVATPSTTASS